MSGNGDQRKSPWRWFSRGEGGPAEGGPAEEKPPPAPVVEHAPEAVTRRDTWLSRLTGGLSKSSGRLSGGIGGLFNKRKLDAATLDELEDLLLEADLGPELAAKVTARLAEGRYDTGISAEDVRKALAAEVEQVLARVARTLTIHETHKPHVVVVVGVNGTGKTTTIGKLAARFRREGRKVLLVAGDTFRAAAIDQLRVWAERTGAEIMAREPGADSAGLVYDALAHARTAGSDVVLIDTAGRLQNKAALMGELEKLVRVLRKQDATAPQDVILVLDATTGQNALKQVEVFCERAGVTGLIMTKLDGTAKGGILVAIAARFSLPVHALGVGEGIEDLQPFAAAEFASALTSP